MHPMDFWMNWFNMWNQFMYGYLNHDKDAIESADWLAYRISDGFSDMFRPKEKVVYRTHPFFDEFLDNW